ncbi:hypothetical protein GUITHDRAFT_154101 [Guillardia theta CCMP2712]|uniref:Uncharacterized protein n=1 Tax=Guillardia theta (strain CCMP2712) TaxID=905079 RepID=L1IXF4_GUITC|nr:hypothetical protein GUITHDRAFT_154101 [Guillardia theta CCMP2712]EKX40569.1 hypothetical protein GUITHDRAFT_154101 [Guillardia theta CCMP2712]|eukprot:XP_005827549.1 hypothetical protein GUITHDRAFT_154101 [Guillardia theta CCMP2712]
MLLWMQTEKRGGAGNVETKDLQAAELAEFLAGGQAATVDVLRIFFFRAGCKEEIMLEVDVRAKTCLHREKSVGASRAQGHDAFFEHMNAQRFLTTLMKPGMKRPNNLIANTSENWELWEGPDDAEDTEVECLLDNSAQPVGKYLVQQSG